MGTTRVDRFEPVVTLGRRGGRDRLLVVRLVLVVASLLLLEDLLDRLHVGVARRVGGRGRVLQVLLGRLEFVEILLLGLDVLVLALFRALSTPILRSGPRSGRVS